MDPYYLLLGFAKLSNGGTDYGVLGSAAALLRAFRFGRRLLDLLDVRVILLLEAQC